MHKRALAELPDAVDEGVLAANQKVEDEKARQLLMKAASELLDTDAMDEASVASVASQQSKASNRSNRSRRRSGAPPPSRRRSQGSVDGNLTSL